MALFKGTRYEGPQMPEVHHTKELIGVLGTLLLGTTALIRPLESVLKELVGKPCGLVLRTKM